MNEKLLVPRFASEAEEAQWWFDNQERFGEDLHQAMKDGTAGRGTAMKRALAMQEARLQNSVLPEPADVEKARSVAEKKGISYEDLLKQIIHSALQQELISDSEHAEAA